MYVQSYFDNDIHSIHAPLMVVGRWLGVYYITVAKSFCAIHLVEALEGFESAIDVLYL